MKISFKKDLEPHNRQKGWWNVAKVKKERYGEYPITK